MREIIVNIKTWLKTKNYEIRFKLFFMLPLIAVLLIIDWSTKGWAAANQDSIDGMDGVPGFIKFKYILNHGFAWGSMADHQGAVIFMAAFITIICLAIFCLSSNKMIIATVAVIMGGSIGNLFGRIWAPLDYNGKSGGVVDFLIWDFWNMGTYIFNMADFFVNVGIGLACLTTILYIIEAVRPLIWRKKNEKIAEQMMDIRQENLALNTIYEKSFWSKKALSTISSRADIKKTIKENKLRFLELKKSLRKPKG